MDGVSALEPTATEALGKLSEGPVPSLVYPALVTQTEQHAGVASGNPR